MYNFGFASIAVAILLGVVSLTYSGVVGALSRLGFVVALLGAVILFVADASSKRRHPASFLMIGTFLGGLLGYLLRPSAQFVGQLPLGTVLTRGAGLAGADVLLVPTAQSSFNILLVGIILGGVIGLLFGIIAKRMLREGAT